MSIVRSVCPKDCYDTCALLTHVKGGKVVKVEGDPEHPITRGFLCVKGYHHLDLLYHPERVLFPLKRVGDRFEKVSWDEALREITDRFKAICEEHGGRAILPFSYGGDYSIVGRWFAERLWHKMNASQLEATICISAGEAALKEIYGTCLGMDPLQLRESKLFIAWGFNPRETNLHGFRLTREIHPYIVIDPVRTSTAEAADLYLQVRAGTDSALAMGVMRVLIEEGLVDRDFIEAHTEGYEALERRVLSYRLANISQITQVPETLIEELAHLYSEHRPGALHIGWGIQRNRNGGEMVSAISMLPALTGQIGVPGGGLLYYNFGYYGLKDISYRHLRTEEGYTINMNQIGKELASSDRIRALYVYNANPAAVCPNVGLVRKGLEREDLFVVVHDLFLTDTARYADFVLPACTFFEREDLNLSYYHLFAKVNHKAIDPLGESKSNREVFRLLAEYMGYTEACFRQTAEEVMREALEGTGMRLEELQERAVHCKGREYTAFGDRKFSTPSGRIELAVPTYTPQEGEGYRLLTPRTRFLLNSQWGNVEAMKRWRNEGVLMHPEDGERDGVREGDLLRISNERGSFRSRAVLSDRVPPGVLVAYMRWGENANLTTPDDLADLGHGSTFNTNYVKIEKGTR
jgi:anaerobic selenocysteine-containing dehydrogenase